MVTIGLILISAFAVNCIAMCLIIGGGRRDED